jgi:hypothetical protein
MINKSHLFGLKPISQEEFPSSWLKPTVIEKSGTLIEI